MLDTLVVLLAAAVLLVHISRRFGLGSPAGGAVAVLDAAVAYVEERVLWDRYGL